jgi:hypothetical protein
MMDVDVLFQQEVDALQLIISQLLDNGYTSHSCRLAAEFGVYSKDLAIVVVSVHRKSLYRGIHYIQEVIIHRDSL